MNHIKCYFEIPLSTLSKEQTFEDDIQTDDAQCSSQSYYTIILSGLNQTLIEQFIVPEQSQEKRKSSWKNDFIWL